MEFCLGPPRHVMGRFIARDMAMSRTQMELHVDIPGGKEERKVRDCPYQEGMISIHIIWNGTVQTLECPHVIGEYYHLHLVVVRMGHGSCRTRREKGRCGGILVRHRKRFVVDEVEGKLHPAGNGVQFDDA